MIACVRRSAVWPVVLGAALWLGGVAVAQEGEENPYPTEAVVEYAYACIKANGETRENLAACSCSADVVASLLTYERYVEASTYLSMMQLTGEGADIFRNSPESTASIQDLRRAQAEADIRCFKSAN